MFSFSGIKQLPIFMRILFIFLLFFLPLYIIGIVVNIIGANNIKEEISKSVLSQTGYYLKNMEDQLLDIFQLQGIYLNNPDIVKFALLSSEMDAVERIGFIGEIENKLKTLKLNNKTIKEVKVHMSDNGLVLSDTGIMESFNREVFEAIMEQSVFPFAYYEDRLILSPSCNYLQMRPSTPVICFTIELSMPELEKSLQNFIQYENSGAILYGVEQGWHIDKNAQGNHDVSLMFQMKERLQQKIAAGAKEQIDTVKIGKTKYITVYKESEYLKSGLLVFMPEKVLVQNIEGYRKWIWVISILAVVGIIVISNWLHRLARKPLIKLLSAFKKLDEGVLDISIEHKGQDEFRYIYAKFNRMIDRMKGQINETYEQQIMFKNAELKQLQNQINTHFLYNCFFIISRLIKFEDLENAEKLTHHLGRYYQFITRDTFDETKLSKEIEQAKSYVEIQNFRFSDRIACRFEEVPPEFADVLVPRLIVQPLLENCYNHGLKNKEEDGEIIVGIKGQNGDLMITVEDNGDELTDETLLELQRTTQINGATDAEVTGLMNIHRRLQTKYGKTSGVYFARGAGGGLQVTLVICDPSR